MLRIAIHLDDGNPPIRLTRVDEDFLTELRAQLEQQFVELDLLDERLLVNRDHITQISVQR